MHHRIGTLVFAWLALLTPGVAGAAVITSILGNTSPGFDDGDILTVQQVEAVQAGQEPPFDSAHGDDSDERLGGNFLEAWVHLFDPINDPILSATLSIGIWDHDSASDGAQVGAFAVNNFDGTAGLNSLFEQRGGQDRQYNVYQYVISGDALQSLAAGVAGLVLNLVGPTTDAGGGTTPFNGAALVFSVLQIQTRDDTGVVIAAPGTLALLALGLLGGARRDRGGSSRPAHSRP